MITKYTKVRIFLLGFFFAAALVAISAKAIYIQVYQGQWLSKKATGQIKKSVASAGKRGTIYDANGNELAATIDVTSIAVRPRLVEDKTRTARGVARALKSGYKGIRKKLDTQRPFVWLKRQATPKETEAIRKAGFKGIEFISEKNRYYPNTTLAAQVLGFTGIDGSGLEGLEFYYDRYLRGTQVKTTILKDALGNGIDARRQPVQSLQGHSLVLTLDQNIQYLTEAALVAAVKEYNAKSGIAIVMQPKSGAILAMAHAPLFNPNAYEKSTKSRWRNRAVTDKFEAGSTMKIFSAAAALESAGIKPNDIFYCEKGKYRIGSNVVHDVKKHEWLSLQQIIKYSSNIGAVKVAEKTGRKKIYHNLRKFGFGERTGIDAPGEVAGVLTHYSRWSRIDVGAISFGHGLAVTALQLVRAVAAIANDGVLMKPYLVKAITDSEGSIVKEYRPVRIRRVVSARTAQLTRNILKTVITEGGTGVSAALEGYTVCGKTGTARKLSPNGTYDRDRHIASFVGMAPADQPAVAVLVVIDEPQGAHYGGTVAAPVFKKIIQGTLPYLNIAPQSNQKRMRVGLPSEVRG